MPGVAVWCSCNRSNLKPHAQISMRCKAFNELHDKRGLTAPFVKVGDSTERTVGQYPFLGCHWATASFGGQIC